VKVIMYSSILLMGVLASMMLYYGDIVPAIALGICVCLGIFLSVVAVITDTKYAKKQREIYKEYAGLLKEPKEKP